MPLRLDDDTLRRQRLRRNKAAALGLLLAMAGLLLLTYLVREPNSWTLLLRAAAEAGLVGGLADWFAVTALFRRPLGLPIPHTGIVAAQQERIGHGIGRFVERNFLAPDLIAARLQALDPAQQLAGWLARNDHARRAADRLVQSLPTLIGAVEDRGLRDFLAHTLGEELGKIDLAPALGRTLKVMSASGEGNALFDRGLDGLLDLVHENRARIQMAIERRTAWWIPRAIDRKIMRAILQGIEETVSELRRPDSEARQSLQLGLERLILNLVQSSEHRDQLEALKAKLLDDPDIRAWLFSIWDQLRSGLLDDLAKPGDASRTNQALASILISSARILAEDQGLRRRVNELVAAAVLGTTASLRGEISRFIAEVVHGWNTATIVDRLELAIGTDLQYVRINGTLVGAIVGCCLFLLHLAFA